MFASTIKWHRASEELPKESCEVLAISNIGRLFYMNYSDKNKAFNSTDNDNGEYENENILCWAYVEEILYWVYVEEILLPLPTKK